MKWKEKIWDLTFEKLGSDIAEHFCLKNGWNELSVITKDPNDFSAQIIN